MTQENQMEKNWVDSKRLDPIKVLRALIELQNNGLLETTIIDQYSLADWKAGRASA